MTLALTAFEARTDMLKHTRAASDDAPRAVRVKTTEEKWGAVLEGVLCMHGCVDASSLPPVYTALAATPKGGGEDCVAGSLPDPHEHARRGDDYSARLPPFHKRLIHGVPSPRHEFKRFGEQDLPATSLGNVYNVDAVALRRAAGL